MKNNFTYVIVFFMMLLGIVCNSENQSQVHDNLGMDLPDGFMIDVYADEVPNARSMALSDNGVLFVGTRQRNGMVYAIEDNNKDYKADRIYVVAENLNMPNGVAVRGNDLYVAEVHRVIKFENIESTYKNSPSYTVVNDSFPTDTHHGWKFIRFGPDGKLYVPVGAPCNVCFQKDTRYSSILRMNPDGSDLQLYAEGIRNTVGFDWDPQTKELWFTDNGRDMLGDDIPPDELNNAPDSGYHFGFPFLHGNNVPDPEFSKDKDLSIYRTPAIALGPHVAALGMRFYTGDMFPKEYKNQIFIAEHGSWNRSEKIGYRVSVVKLKDNKAVSYEPFIEGWLRGEAVSGRPVDVQIMPDGSMLISDDYGGRIYRVTYQRPE
ncbi:MAG: sorbosone dehydrogenase family protein [Ignavibacteriales bacterium]|nr:MAG: sorbosone dehydrogenase family protein [Ignavibacteriales bacterium]